MQILPIYSQNNNNQNFQAVSQKYLQRAEREFFNRKQLTGDLFVCLSNEVYYGIINKIDGIDTLNAIKKYSKKTMISWTQTMEFFQKL